MTLEELKADVWDSLSIKRHVAGRRLVDRIVERAVARWPVPVLRQCDAQETAVVGHHLAKSLEREARQNVGMGFFASLILVAIINEIVKILVQRWIDDRASMMEALA